MEKDRKRIYLPLFSPTVPLLAYYYDIEEKGIYTKPAVISAWYFDYDVLYRGEEQSLNTSFMVPDYCGGFLENDETVGNFLGYGPEGLTELDKWEQEIIEMGKKYPQFFKEER